MGKLLTHLGRDAFLRSGLRIWHFGLEGWGVGSDVFSWRPQHRAFGVEHRRQITLIL